MSWCFPNICAPSGVCPPIYQPLPINTGNVGIDRCGNIEVYAAPRTVQRQVCWPTCSWPIPPSFVGWRNSGVGEGGGSGMGALASVMTMGAPMAEWLINARRQGTPQGTS